MNRKSRVLCFMVIVPLQAQGMGFARALLGKGHAFISTQLSSLGVNQRLSLTMPRLAVFGSLGGVALVGGQLYNTTIALAKDKKTVVPGFIPSLVELQRSTLDKAKKEGNREQQMSLLFSLWDQCQTQEEMNYIISSIESLVQNRPNRSLSYFITPQQRDQERALERLAAHKELLMKQIVVDSAIQS